MYVSTTEATIKNFTITGGKISIYIYNATDINILNCKLSYATKHGIYLTKSSNISILQTEIFSNAEDSIRIDHSSSYNTISCCSILQNGLDGISIFETSNNNTISNTSVSSNGLCAIFISNSSYNAILSSDISKNKHGIFLSNSSNNFITDTTISFSNYVGIAFYLATNNYVTNSTVIDNYAGFHISNSTDNLIFHNNFINNTYQAFDVDGNNSWDNGVEGNYWSDYAGEDADGDGIGDTPYIIDIDSRDNFPLVAPFNGINKQQTRASEEGSECYLQTIIIVSIIICVVPLAWTIAKKVKQKKG